MNKLNRVVAFTALAISLSASPVWAVETPIPIYTETSSITTKSLSASKVAQAISTCSAGRGWKFSKAGSGKMVGQLTVRGKHYVEVGVEYSAKAYKITYRDSKNMKYDVANNTIHRRYNSWLENLDNDVKFCLR